MKNIKPECIVTTIGVFLSLLSIYLINNYMNKRVLTKTEINITEKTNLIAEEVTTSETTTTEVPTTTTSTTTTTKTILTTTTKRLLAVGNEVVWDGLTMDELIIKLDKNLYDTMANTGIYFAQYTAKTGLDPYLAVSIINLETGCKWGCSSLVNNCYNIGGLKGSPKCNGGSYMKYDTLEEGIDGYLDILYNRYWSEGLTTPELMNPKYAASTEWANKVNNYYHAIEES